MGVPNTSPTEKPLRNLGIVGHVGSGHEEWGSTSCIVFSMKLFMERFEKMMNIEYFHKLPCFD